MLCAASDIDLWLVPLSISQTKSKYCMVFYNERYENCSYFCPRCYSRLNCHHLICWKSRRTGFSIWWKYQWTACYRKSKSLKMEALLPKTFRTENKIILNYVTHLCFDFDPFLIYLRLSWKRATIKMLSKNCQFCEVCAKGSCRLPIYREYDVVD